MNKVTISLLTVLMMIMISSDSYSQTYIVKSFNDGRLLVPQESNTGTTSFDKVDKAASFGAPQEVRISGSSGASRTTKKYVPLSGDPTIRIKLFKKDTNGSAIKEWTRSYSQIKNTPNNEPDSGKIAFSITESDQVLPSRYNYFLLFYLDAQQHLKSLWSEEFMGQDALGIPIGTIFPVMGGNDAYFAAMESQGWYLCNGRNINDLNELEPKEKDTLVKIMIEGGNPNWWKLPDLRGMFLRGATNSNTHDPDYSNRDALINGTFVIPNWFVFVGGTPWNFSLVTISDKKLGSTQNPEVGVHGHTGSTGNAGGHDHGGYTGYNTVNVGYREDATTGGTPFNGAENNSSIRFSIPWQGDHSHSVTINNSTGTETRPKNVYVNYIMKCRR